MPTRTQWRVARLGMSFPPRRRNVDVYSKLVLYQDRGEQGPADAGDRIGLALTR
jgi:hypothetical protein